MNKVILMGRLVADPEVRYSQGDTPMAIARYRLAVNRKYNRNSDGASADFINCIAFGKIGEVAEKYLRKGFKVVVTGRIQTGSYTNNDGVEVYTTDVVVEEHEFAESKGSNMGSPTIGDNNQDVPDSMNGFKSIPDGIPDDELPFN